MIATAVDFKSAVRIKFKNLPHIRSVCQKTELSRNSSHHRIRRSVANIFHQNKLFEMFEEVYCQSITDNNAQNLCADITVIDKSKDRGLVLNPTVRWKTNDPQPDRAVDEEKYLWTMHSIASTTIWYHKLGSIWTLIWSSGYSFRIFKIILPVI